MTSAKPSERISLPWRLLSFTNLLSYEERANCNMKRGQGPNRVSCHLMPRDFRSWPRHAGLVKHLLTFTGVRIYRLLLILAVPLVHQAPTGLRSTR